MTDRGSDGLVEDPQSAGLPAADGLQSASDQPVTWPEAAGRLRGRGWTHPRELACAGVVIATAFVVRAVPVLHADFPLNDGGLFYAMAHDLQRSGLALPATASYNGAVIPFVYPPLGLYLAAIVGMVVPLTGVFQWLPLLFSCLAIPAFYLLAREMVPTRFHALVATAAYGLAPESFQWMIEGGGVTRAPGLVFALLALWLTCRVIRLARPRDVIAAGVATGLAVLSHPNAALFAMLAIVLLTLRARRPAIVPKVVAIAALGVLVSSPWWLTTLARVGPSGLVSAGSLGGPFVAVAYAAVNLLSFGITHEVAFPMIASCAVLGTLILASRRSWILVVWLALELLDQRLGTVFGMVPLAMLAATGLIDGVLPTISGRCRAVPHMPSDDETLLPPTIWAIRPARWVLIFGLAISTLSGLITTTTADSPDYAVSADVRSVASWVRANTPTDAQFVVVTGDAGGNEGEQEWFPVLSGRVVLATPQGREWLGGQAWKTAMAADEGLQACAAADAACLGTWSITYHEALDYVFIPSGQLRGPTSPADCCRSLRDSLRQSPGFTVVFEGAGGSVFRRDE